MKNEFKEFFELTKQFQMQKIQNDVINFKKFNKNKFLTICLASLACFFGIYSSLNFISNYDGYLKKFRFKMMLRKLVYFSYYEMNKINDNYQGIKTNKNYSKLERSIDRYQKLIELVDMNLLKYDDDTIFYFLKILKKELYRIHRYYKNDSKRKNNFLDYDNFDKTILSNSLFEKSFDKLNFLLHYDISYLPYLIEILELLLNIYKKTNYIYDTNHQDIDYKIDYDREIISHTKKFCIFFENNPDIFKVLFYSDYEKFYKLKKIFTQLEKMKSTNIDNNYYQNEFDKIKSYIMEQEKSVENILRFV